MRAFNSEAFIGGAIESILCQTFRNFELIVVDDCSSDRTDEIVRAVLDPRVRYFRNANRLGFGMNLNKGILKARSDLIAIVDSDDVMVPWRLERQVEFLDKNEDVSIVDSLIIKCERGKVFPTASRSDDPIGKVPMEKLMRRQQINRLQLAFSNMINQPAAAGRRSFFLENPYSQIAYGEDYLLWTQVVDKVLFWQIPEELMFYRIHPEQSTNRQKDREAIVTNAIRLPYMRKLGIPLSGHDVKSAVNLFGGAFECPRKEVRAVRSLVHKLRQVDKFKSQIWTNLVSQQYFAFLYGQNVLSTEHFLSWIDLFWMQPQRIKRAFVWLCRIISRRTFGNSSA